MHFPRRCFHPFIPFLKNSADRFPSHVFAACFASSVLLKRTPIRCSLSFGNRKKSDGAVAAIPIEILSKFPLSPLQNALEHCHDGRGFLGEALLGAF